MRESNSHQRFWRPLSYHLTNPLCTNIDYHLNGNLSILFYSFIKGMYLQNFIQRFTSFFHILLFSDDTKTLFPSASFYPFQTSIGKLMLRFRSHSLTASTWLRLNSNCTSFVLIKFSCSS